MKALTLHQPWAHLVAIGAKRIETRSWATSYRGRLAIHASANKRFINMRSVDYLCATEPFYSVLQGDAERTGRLMQLGAVVATCELRECVYIPPFPTRYISSFPFYNTKGMHPNPWYKPAPGDTDIVIPIPPPEPELSFGDYTPGRYMWLLDSIQMLPEPIQAKGALGLWEWQP